MVGGPRPTAIWLALGSALVAHSQAVGRDGPTLLSGSLHERIVRALRCRDRIHMALLVPQNNKTADEEEWSRVVDGVS
jgi:hypothetical protein